MFDDDLKPVTIRSLAISFISNPTQENFDIWKKHFCEKIDSELKNEEMLKLANNLERFSRFVCEATKNNTVNGCVKESQNRDWVDKKYMLVFNDSSDNYGSHMSPLLCENLGLAPNGRKFSRIKNDGVGIFLFLSNEFVPFDTNFISTVAHKVSSQGYGWFCNLPALEEQYAHLPVDQKEGAFWHVDDENKGCCVLFQKGEFNKEKSNKPYYAAKSQKNTHYQHYECGIDIESYRYDLSLQTEFILLNTMFKFMLEE